MNSIDLVKLVRAFKNNNMSKVKVYGKIVKRVEKPANIGEKVRLVPNGMFVQVDVFAVNLSNYASFLQANNYDNVEDNYMVNGSIVTYIEKDRYKLPDWYSLCGTITISRDINDNIMALFSWRKDNNGYYIEYSTLDDINSIVFDNDADLNLWFTKSCQENKVVRPPYVSNLTPFNAEKIVFNPNYKGLDAQMATQINEQPLNLLNTTISKEFIKESREDIKPFSNKYNEYLEQLKKSGVSREKFIDFLKEKYSFDNSASAYIVNLVNKLKASFKHKTAPDTDTGRSIIKTYLYRFGRDAKAKYLGTSAAEFLLNDFEEVSQFILNGCVVNCDGVAWNLCKAAFSDPEKFYAGAVCSFLSIDYDKLIETQELLSDNGISFSKLINENPYALQMVSDFSYSDIDYIVLCFGKINDNSLERYKNIAIMHSFIEDRSNGSTVFNIQDIKKSQLGSKLTEVKYNKCRESGTYLSKADIANITYYLDKNDFRYNVLNFKKKGYTYIETLSGAVLDKAISDYVSSGLGVSLNNNYITSCYMLEKELNVYEFAYSLGKQKNNFDHAEIDKLIDKYEEEEVGFKLEPEQRQAVHLIDNKGAIIAGSAGSGKTTISNCMVYVLKQLNPSVDIKFSAPTGKAAKRMQEVVKDEVKTLNSRFKIFGYKNNLFDSNEADDSDIETVHMFDEGAMITVDLLRSVFHKMSETDSLYLFGDFHQLSPIGKGLPFKDLLRYMPCQFLNVSKRAAEGSSITFNSDLVNNFSEYNNFKPLQSGRDFNIVPCSNDDITECVKDICSYYLDKMDGSQVKQTWGIADLPDVENLTPDDIQVVTPVAKPTYTFSSTRLNNVLQPLFNPTKDYRKTFVYQNNPKNYTKFVFGDRVIHTESNMYSMQWYESVDNGVCKKRFGFGICNGEVGKVVGYINTDNCTFEDEDWNTRPADFKYPENMRDDAKYSEPNSYFVIVEYYDYLSQSNFYILYRCKETTFECNIGKSFNGDDLAKLNLFYAGTTHKLQGSQAKLVISVLGYMGNYTSGFLTRNMVYTMLTRAEKLEFLIGGVSNENGSVLTKARHDKAGVNITTIGDIL